MSDTIYIEWSSSTIYNVLCPIFLISKLFFSKATCVLLELVITVELYQNDVRNQPSEMLHEPGLYRKHSLMKVVDFLSNVVVLLPTQHVT